MCIGIALLAGGIVLVVPVRARLLPVTSDKTADGTIKDTNSFPK